MKRRAARILPLCLALGLGPAAVRAAEPEPYSSQQLQALDGYLEALEAQERSGKFEKVQPEMTQLVGRRQVAGMLDLFTTRRLARAHLSPSEIARYQDRPAEFSRWVAPRELGAVRHRRMTAVFIERLKRGGVPIQREALRWLSYTLDDPALLDPVRQRLKSDDFEVRFESARLLALFKDAGGRAILEEALASPNLTVLVYAVADLHKLGVPAGLDRVRSVARSTSAAVSPNDRGGAISLLGNLHDRESAGLFVGSLKSEHPAIARAGLGAVRGNSGIRLKPEDLKHVERIIDSGWADTLSVCLGFEVLKSNAGKAAREILLSYRNDPDPFRRRGLLMGMTTNGVKKDVPWMAAYLDDDEPEVRFWAETAIASLSGVPLGDPARDLDAAVRRRKEWWASRKGDPEYR